MKRALILFLAFMMCVSVLVGCKKGEPGDTGAVNTGDGQVEDELGNHNFGGADFTILSRTETSYEHIGELNGDSVSEAVYKRNLAVSERFGVNIKVIELSGAYDDRAGFVTNVRASYMSSQSPYDLISTHSVYLGWFGSEGILSDLEALPTVDLTKNYWNQNLYNELNIDGSCYIMIGDIAHTLYEYISVMFVNTEILADNRLIEGGIDGLYDMVEAGDWTWGEMYELAENYGTGSEGLADPKEGSYGLVFNTHAMRAGMLAQEASIYKKGADGRFYMESAAGQHLVDAVENMAKFFRLPNMYFQNGWLFDQDELNPMFMSKKTLFYGQILGESSKFATEMGEGYAVLPLPKFNGDQDNYYTICGDEVTAVAVVSNVKNKEMSGVITQALAKYGYENVTPEYYEKALKYRYANDPRCPEILELIRSSLTIESVPTYYETSIDSDMFRDIVMQGQTGGVSSRYGTYAEQGNTEIANFYKKIDIIRG